MDERVVQSSHKIGGFLVADQCDQIRCSLTENNLTVVGKILSVYSVFWQNFDHTLAADFCQRTNFLF